MSTVEGVLGLVAAVAVSALLARRFKVSYPILSVMIGLVLGFTPGISRFRIEPELVFVLFLPPLLFPAALFASWRDFTANIRPILLHGVGLVLVTMVAVALLGAQFIPELPLAGAFVLGAIIAPPDAIAVTAIANRLSIPRRIIVILEGESLVNDATALVAYRFGVAAVVTGSFSLAHAAGQFVLVAIGGVAIGLLVGWLAAAFHRRIDDPPIEITVSLMTPFIAYLGAERLHVSGVLAVVSAGLYLGWRLPEITNSRMRLQAGPVWQMVEFLLNGLVFILIGLQLPEVLRALSGRSIPQLIFYALLVSIAAILVRILWVFPATYLPRWFSRKLRERDPYPRWEHVAIVAWTGVRGADSLAAAMALPLVIQGGAAFPARDLIVFLTFAVIFATLVVQGATLPALIRRLGVEDDKSEAREECKAREKANEAALARLNELAASRDPDDLSIHRLRIEYEDRIAQLERSESADGERPHIFSSDYEQLSFELLQVEREAIVTLRNELVINDEVMRRVQRDIDLAEARLRFPDETL